MVNRLWRSGVSDWLIQRVTAVILAAWVLTLMVGILMQPTIGYEQWRALFEPLPMRLFSLLTLAALCAHGWIGMWTIGTDYLTTRQLGQMAPSIRRIYQVLCVLLIVLYLTWGIQIFWSN
ncbi:MAG: succinate dehydrogenase, hydrophobic membrane anchor protein [Gammaproteobacteria bacterium]|nr:succinate dehydrogenase, hydrophobic membrane anchor protein [Gammaproteobacteria bacterium]